MAKDIKNDTVEASDPATQDSATAKEKKKARRAGRTRRWSAADSVIAFLVILSVAGIIYRLFLFDDKVVESGGNVNSDGNIYALEYTVESTYEAVADSIKAMDKVSLLETGDYIGYVAPYDDYSPVISKKYLDGSSAGAEDETDASGADGDVSYELVSLEGVLFCNASTMQSGSLYIAESERFISPGSEITVCTDTAILNIKVISIYPLD